MKVTWNGKTIAESYEYSQIEENKYVSSEVANHEYFKKSSVHTRCAWKGTTSCYRRNVDGKLNKDAAWYYPEPSKAASKIKNHIVFWKEAEVINE